MKMNRDLKVAFLISIVSHLWVMMLPLHLKVGQQFDLTEVELVEVNFKEMRKAPVLEKMRIDQMKEPLEVQDKKEEVVEKYEIDEEFIKVLDEIKENPLAKREYESKYGERNLLFLKYLAGVRQKIKISKYYPKWARFNGLEGKVELKFLLHSNGKVSNIEVIESSGYEMLDDAAIKTLRRAEPFDSYRDILDRRNVAVRVPIVFEVE